MVNQQAFQPNWASPPGDTIVDLLEDRGFARSHVAPKLGYSKEQFEGLLRGQIDITDELACLLEQHIGGSRKFWIKREALYRSELARLDQGQRSLTQHSWIQGLPIRDMLSFGWLRNPSSPDQLFARCLEFFGVVDLEQWQLAYSQVLEQTSYRTSPVYQTSPEAVAAWLRQGELQTASRTIKPWSATKFRDAMITIRSLTRKKAPESFLSELTEHCAACGVALAIVRAPSGCRASGAARFLGGNKALIQLSFRYLSDDHFWFTFFHEAGHLILHDKGTLFLEGDGAAANQQEDEANEFAASILIPAEHQEELYRLGADSLAVIRFARKIGISPGIVVGQMQHLGLLSRRQLNRLKRRYVWA